MNFINNINETKIRFVKDKVYNEKNMDAEHYATGYFKELNFKVNFTKKVSPNYYDEEIRDALKDSYGRPDLIIESKYIPREYFFVEVKQGDDGLRGNQLEWIKNHPEVKVIIFYVEHVKKEMGI